MKALSIGIAMLIGIMAVIWYGVSYLQSYAADIECALDGVCSAYDAGDKQAALEMIGALKERADGAHDILCMMIDHAQVAEADASVLRLEELCMADDAKAFHTECRILAARVRNMYLSEKLSLANVL
ncbi:MAG: DUF4363 family protein [Clostridia bacterium]|nr:DUF4363 family protein [Clostridia bacterium]